MGKMAIPSKISGVNLTDLLGQLLVVARHTDTSPSSCYEPELIPDHRFYEPIGEFVIWDQVL